MPTVGPQKLISLARGGVLEAAQTPSDGRRYAIAHLAALRAAAAVLSARATPASRSRRGQIVNVWAMLVLVTPELTEWASFFSAGMGKRTAAEAGLSEAVTSREADDLVRAVDQFIGVVEEILGLSSRRAVGSLSQPVRLAS